LNINSAVAIDRITAADIIVGYTEPYPTNGITSPDLNVDLCRGAVANIENDGCGWIVDGISNPADQ